MFIQAWIPPLGYRGCTREGAASAQVTCSDDGRVIQYAYKAYAARPQKVSGYWAPHQAVGKEALNYNWRARKLCVLRSSLGSV